MNWSSNGEKHIGFQNEPGVRYRTLSMTIAQVPIQTHTGITIYSNSALKGQKNVYVIHFQLVTDRFSQTTEIEIEIEINNFT